MTDTFDLIDDFHERAAIIQYEGRQSLRQSELLAKKHIQKQYKLTDEQANAIWVQHRIIVDF